MILVALSAFVFAMPLDEGVIGGVLRGDHWHGCRPQDRAALEGKFLRLSRMPYPALRKACLAYSRTMAPEVREEEIPLRQYDVAIIARAKYFEEFRRSKPAWFGPGFLFTKTPGWVRSRGKLRLELSNFPYFFEPNYNGVGELDHLYELRRGRASLRGRSGRR